MDNIDFDKRIREIMETHTEEPSVNSWDLIVSNLQRRRDVRIRRNIYLYSAAAALLLFVLINPHIFLNRDDVKVRENILSHDLFIKRTPEITVVENLKHPTGIIGNRRTAFNEIHLNGDTIVENGINREEIEPIEEKESVVISEEANRVSEGKPDNRVMRNNLSDPFFDDMPHKNIGGRPILALSTGVSPSYSGTYTPPLMMASSYDGGNNVNPMFSSAAVPHESMFHGEEYMMPITIGVQIFFPITDKFSVGTGINYSMLSTKYYVTSMNTTERRRVTIHYGGVPLNFQYKIYSGNRFRFYALGGTTIEKGLDAVDKNLISGSVINESDEIRGVQLSVLAGLGVEYGIFNSVGVYFDPNITYYFDNKKKPQPFSIRTVQPLLFRFEAGLRFRL